MKNTNLEQIPLEKMIKNGYVFVRCIPPTGMNLLYNETGIDIEIRKILREKGKPSLTKKSANTHGYPMASCSLIGEKTAIFGSVGYGIINPPLNDIMSVSTQNAGTGCHKKNGESQENIKENLEKLKAFVFKGGNTQVNNEVEINIHQKTPISFVFAYPGYEFFALCFKEKFKNYMGIHLPLVLYSRTNYPQNYQIDKHTVCSFISKNSQNIDLVVTLFDYYKDNPKVLETLKSSITSQNIVGFLKGNMHISNFINSFALADKLNIPIDSPLTKCVEAFTHRLEIYSTFDRQNKIFFDHFKNKHLNDVITFLKKPPSHFFKPYTHNFNRIHHKSLVKRENPVSLTLKTRNPNNPSKTQKKVSKNLSL